MTISPRTALPLVLLSLACTGSADTADTTAAFEASTPAPAAGSPTTGTAQSATSFTAADLDQLERGLRREIELVRDAQRRSSTATTPAERGQAMQDAFEVNTVPRAAETVGMPVDRYRAIRETVKNVLTTLDFQGKIDGPMSVDTARADAALRARLSSDPIGELPAGSAAALHGRLDRLAPVWIEYITLTAVGG